MSEVKRMSAEQLEWIRYLADGGGGDFTDEHCDLSRECLTEIDALKFDLAAAEQRGREAGKQEERARVVNRARVNMSVYAGCMGDRNDAARGALDMFIDEIERGEHDKETP